MNKIIFSVLDSAAGTFGSPWVVPHVGLAMRAFTDEVNSGSNNSDLVKHPEDFSLYEIGSYNDVTGIITPLDVPKLIAQAKSLKV